MKRMLLKSLKTIVPEEVATPVPGNGEILIKVSKVAVCGSDISAFYGKHPYIPFPMVLGHEFSGTVQEAGPDTPSLPIGSRVTVLPHLPCRKCAACANKQYNLCGALKALGCQAYGAQAEYVKVPADMVFALPDNVSMEAGALVEPIAVAYHGTKKAVGRGDTVLVLGAGGIGLSAMQSANILGAGRTVVADFSAKRLELAKSLGAADVIDLSGGALKDLAPAVGDFTVYCDCVGGNGAALSSIIETARRGVKVVCIGVIAQDFSIPNLPDLTEKELTFFGSNMYVAGDFIEVIEHLSAGSFKTEGIFTHRYDLDKVPEMYAFVDGKKGEYIKLMIEVSR